MASISNSTVDTITVAEESLRQLPKSQFNELRSYAKPPLACLSIFECIGILLEPSKDQWDWDDDKKLMMPGADKFLQRLFDLDKDQINSEQIKKLNIILNQDECQPNELKRISSLCHELGTWLRAVLKYTTEKQQQNK
ncbi:hypothetical protein I4U23_004457 [Adineta vaga]|nr:hypothetical protein I4U23_004457 [Adineta vaga]